jgi:biopolymer transport protein ExbD
MKQILLVCLVALALGGVGQRIIAQSPALQKGVSVEMVATNNAKPMPEADHANAWVISVTGDGRLWFGVTPVTPDSLADAMTRTPRNRDQRLYIKADARVPYAEVQKVLKAVHIVEIESPVLLTSQRAPSQPGGMRPPMGLEVWVENGALSGPKPVEIDISATQGSANITVNGEAVPWTNLQGTLKQLFQNRTENVVRLKADEDLPFAQVVRAIDVCRSTNAKVILATPTI